MNAGRNPLFILNQDCKVITNRVIQEVEAAGMQTLRTFDLEVVRSSNNGFCCPTHGRSTCTCQLVILLITQKIQGTQTLILEGKDQQTWVYLDHGQGTAEEQVDPFLTNALLHAFFSVNRVQ